MSDSLLLDFVCAQVTNIETQPDDGTGTIEITITWNDWRGDKALTGAATGCGRTELAAGREALKKGRAKWLRECAKINAKTNKR